MKTQILVLGAGYSGLIMALRLARMTAPLGGQVTLVNDAPDFADRIRLHEHAARQLAARPLADVLRDSPARLVIGRVESIDTGERVVRIADAPDSLGYDHLIVALGSGVDLDRVPGLRVHAFTLSPQSATALRAALPAIARRHGALLVAGGGLTGIEAATELAEAYPGLRVTLATAGAFGTGLSAQAARHVRRAFERMQIDLREYTRVTKLEAGRALVDAGDIAFDACLWAGPMRAPALLREAGLRVNAQDQALVDGAFRALSHPSITVVGDAATLTVDVGAQPRMACAAAVAMAGYAADAVLVGLRGRAPEPFRLGYLSRNISLGRRDAVIDWVDPDDGPRNRIWTGRLAAAYKQLIGWNVWRSILAERRASQVYQLPRRATRGSSDNRAQHV
jgi:NADH:ubiquinone reductase (H+-translocating)